MRGMLKHSLAAKRRLFRRYKQDAKIKGLIFELDWNSFFDLTKQNCLYCNSKPCSLQTTDGRRLADKRGHYIYNGIDRLNSNIGYTLENSVPCCSLCNYMKKQMNKEDFLDHIRKICKHNS